MKSTKTRLSTQKMALAAVMTALVIVLQFLPIPPIGIFKINICLMPIIVGAAVCGIGVGGWLGFVSGMVILLSGEAGYFFAFSVPGTIVTVLAKGIASGIAAGLVYKLLEKLNRYFAVLVAAIVCPVTNTGVFLIGCFTFFFDELAAEGVANGQDNIFVYLIVSYVGFNFLFELISNILLSPVVLRILNIRKKKA